MASTRASLMWIMVGVAAFTFGCDQKKPEPGQPAEGNTPAKAPEPKPAEPTPKPVTPTPTPKPAEPTPKPAEAPKPTVSSNDPILGTWVLDYDSVKAAAVTAAEKQKGGKLEAQEMAMIEQMIKQLADSMSSTIKADGTFTSKAGEEQHEGTWTKEGAVYVFTSKDDPKPVKFKFEGSLLKVDVPADDPMAGLAFRKK